MAIDSPVIFSEEKSTAKIFYILASIFLALDLLMYITAYQKGDMLKLFFISLPFVAFTALFFVIAKFQQRKFDILGLTPLTITQAGQVGGQLAGYIDINKSQFNRIDTVKLGCYSRSYADESSSIDEIYSTKVTPDIEFTEQLSRLHYRFTIADDVYHSQKRSRNEIFWQVSMEYVEKMELIKRTWLVSIDKA